MDTRVLPDLCAEGAAVSWLALGVGFLACLIVPAALWERWIRSDYREYVRYQKALEAQREEYVPPVRELPVHKRTAIRAGVVK